MLSFSQSSNIGNGHIVLRRMPSDRSMRDQGAMLSPSEFSSSPSAYCICMSDEQVGSVLGLESFLSTVGDLVLTGCLPTCRTISFVW